MHWSKFGTVTPQDNMTMTQTSFIKGPNGIQMQRESTVLKPLCRGKYLNGRLYRPAHIHFRISEKNSKELISQIYFQGDPHITEDPWASNPKAEHRILPVAPGDTQGNLSVTFDIYLQHK